MERNIKDALPQQMAQISGKFKDHYAHIELTPDETEEALAKARQAKAAKIKMEQYREKVFTPIVYPIYTAEEFGIVVVNKLRQTFPDYVIDEYNETIFQLLTWYFTGDIRFEEAGYSFRKGIALRGNIGCGKTSLLRAFQINPKNPFQYRTCRSVADEYSHKEHGGPQILSKYSYITEVNPTTHLGNATSGQFFDDLGTEDIGKHYGNEKEVMESILQSRYDNYDLLDKTHITTNLTAEQIEERYGPRVRSRAREQFNWLVFDNLAPDRRK